MADRISIFHRVGNLIKECVGDIVANEISHDEIIEMTKTAINYINNGESELSILNSLKKYIHYRYKRTLTRDDNPKHFSQGL